MDALMDASQSARPSSPARSPGLVASRRCVTPPEDLVTALPARQTVLVTGATGFRPPSGAGADHGRASVIVLRAIP